MSYKQCTKFEPNRFSRIRCQNCFAAKNQHTAEALERKCCSTKATHCGYLFISQDSNFSTALSKSRRWIRRYFVVYSDAHLKYFLDENVEGMPLSDMDLNDLVELSEAEEITTHANSLRLHFVEQDIFIKGVNRDEIRRWGDILHSSLGEASRCVLRRQDTQPRRVFHSSNSTESEGKLVDSTQSVPKTVAEVRASEKRSNLYGESAELEGLFYQKSGWLMLNDKQTNEWAKCWCKLKNGQLSVKMDGCSAVNMLIDVKKCKKVEELTLPFSYGFVLETEGETLTLSVTTESSRDSWCSMLDSIMTTEGRPRSPEIPKEGSVVVGKRDSPPPQRDSEQQAIDSLHAQIWGLQSQLSQVQADFEAHCSLYCAERESSVEKINYLENERSELSKRLEDVLEQYDKLSEENDQIKRSYLEGKKLLEQRTEMYEMLRERARKMSPISDDEPAEVLEGQFPQIDELSIKESDTNAVKTLLTVIKAREINIASLKSQLSMVSGTLSEFHEELMVAIENYKSTEDRLRADNERIARMVSKSLQEIERDETTEGSIFDSKLIHDLKVALCVKDFETQRLRAHVLMLEDEIGLVLAHEERTMKMYRLSLHEKNELTNLYNSRLSEIRSLVHT